MNFKVDDKVKYKIPDIQTLIEQTRDSHAKPYQAIVNQIGTISRIEYNWIYVKFNTRESPYPLTKCELSKIEVISKSPGWL